MARAQDGLNQTQAFAPIFGTTSTRNLLGYGLWALRNARFWETTRDPLLTMLSIGYRDGRCQDRARSQYALSRRNRRFLRFELVAKRY